MEKEDAVNVLQFWLAADNFQSQLAAKKGQYDGQEAQNDAMILYDKWVLFTEDLICTSEIKMHKLNLCFKELTGSSIQTAFHMVCVKFWRFLE